MKLIVTVHWNFLNVSESRPAKIQLPLGAWKVQSDWLMSLSGQMRRSGCLTMVGGAPSPPAWRHRGSVPVLAQDHGGLSSYSGEYFPSKHAALLSGSLTFQWLQTQMCQGFYSWWWSRSPGFHCGWRHYFWGKDSNIYFAWMKKMFKDKPDHAVLECGGVRARLLDSKLWEDFHKLGTEMIITKAGRLDNFEGVKCEFFSQTVMTGLYHLTILQCIQHNFLIICHNLPFCKA